MSASRVLRNAPNVSEDVRRRVTEAAEAMGFRPDPALAVLAAYRNGKKVPAYHGTIAVLMTVPLAKELWKDPRTPWKCVHASTEMLLSGAREIAKLNGYLLEIINIGLTRTEQQNAEGILLSRGIRGLLVHTFPTPYAEISIDWEKFSAVSILAETTVPGMHSVISNHFEGVRLAMKAISERGYQRPGLLVSQAVLEEGSWDTRAAFELEAQRRFRTPAPIFTRIGPFEDEARNIQRWVREHSIDAIIYEGDEWIAGWLERKKIAVPQKLGICCLDLLNPDSSVSGINQNRPMVAAMAVSLLHSQLLQAQYGGILAPASVQIQPSWNEGRTLPPR